MKTALIVLGGVVVATVVTLSFRQTAFFGPEELKSAEMQLLILTWGTVCALTTIPFLFSKK